MKVLIYEYSEKRLRLTILDTVGNQTNARVSEVFSIYESKI
jgi:hypothetical protein